MKNLRTLFLKAFQASPLVIGMLLSPTVTHAYSFQEPVNPTEVKLVGRGVFDEKTHESLGLACKNTGDTCTHLQFVLLKSELNQAFFIGKVYELQTVSEEELKAILHEVKKGFQQQNLSAAQKFCIKANAFFKRPHTTELVGLPTFLGTLFGGALIVASGGVIPGIGLMILVPTAFSVTLYQFKNIPTRTQFGALVDPEAFKNQDGWNWSMNQKKMKSKKFQSLLRYVNSTTNH